jgi:hypothetical protein
MNAKTAIATALVWTAFSWGAVRGQTPGATLPTDPVPPSSGGGISEVAPQPARPFTLSSWIRGDDFGCCGEAHGGPIDTELFFRTGPSLVAGNGTVADVLQTGIYVQGGARVLFFDQSAANAWTVELGIANIYNHAHAPTTYTGIPLNILVTGSTGPVKTLATLTEVDRTFVDLAGGREWYLSGSAISKGCTNWRIGFDAGGRWGSESADFNEIKHRTDTIAGIFAAVHTDIEIPMGCAVFQAGFRIEYGYTWSDILQIQNNSDVQDVNLLFTIGIRY